MLFSQSIAIEIGILALFGLLLWIGLPWLLLALRNLFTGKKPASYIENQYRTATLQLLAGFILISNFIVAVQQVRETRNSAEVQSRDVQRSADMADRSQQLAKAYELIGKKTATERIGGIVGLKDWADRTPVDELSKDVQVRRQERYASILPAILNYIRDQTAFQVTDERCGEFNRYRPLSLMIGPDVEHALSIVAQNSGDQGRQLPFRGLNLSRAKLTAGQFEGELPQRKLKLDKSSFAYSDLSEAQFNKSSLKGADLYCANLYRADLTSTMFTDYVGGSEPKSTNMIGTYLVKSILKDTQFDGALLMEARFDESTISAGTDFSDADLRSAQFFYVKFEDPDGIIVNKNTNIENACFIGEEFNSVSSLSDLQKKERQTKFDMVRQKFAIAANSHTAKFQFLGESPESYNRLDMQCKYPADAEATRTQYISSSILPYFLGIDLRDRSRAPDIGLSNE
jgi:hypothetical protein